MPAWLKFQRWVSDRLRKAGLRSLVGCQSHGGLGSFDVDAHPFAIECKLHQKTTYALVVEALRQIHRDCRRSDKYPIAITEDKHGNVIVHMDFKDFENFVMEYVVPAITKKEEGGEPPSS